MYVGRIVAIGMNREGRACAMYRVSSRSFPNRQARILEHTVAILPKPGHEGDIYKNPYIAYNCARIVGRQAVVTNGSHTDFVAEKMAAGIPMRDALIQVLHNMDYEHDSLNTPRIAATVDVDAAAGYLGIVRHDALHVRRFALERGRCHYVATYEQDEPGERYTDGAFDPADANAACACILGEGVFAELERPVTACCLVWGGSDFQVAIQDAKQE